MAVLALLNDVECELEASSLVVGGTDDPPTAKGDQQAITIAKNIHGYLGRLDEFAASNAERLSRLIHHIRVKSKDSYLTRLKVRYLDALAERSFGVMDGSRINITSDLFTHTRIAAEGGESIFQVRQRMVSCVDSMVVKNKKVLVASHPFACQIAFNALLGKTHILLTRFWFKKGALALLSRDSRWEFIKAVNLLEEKEFGIDELYIDTI